MRGRSEMMERSEAERRDSLYEGRDEYYMDIDRMINEGMAGGAVYGHGDDVNIEEARDLVKEEPPYEAGQ